MIVETKEAFSVLEKYLRRLDRATKNLPEEIRKDLRTEISVHIADSIASSAEATELERLLDAIERLGDPEIFLRPMIADYTVEIASSTFSPRDLLRALAVNIGAGLKRTVQYTFFSFLYLTLFLFVILFIAKVFFPLYTGLFYFNGEFQGFGFNAQGDQYTEVLGFWFLPIITIAFIAEYLFLGLLMKIFRNRR
jgi:hypothetical protein